MTGPVFFQTEILGRTLWREQEHICDSIRTNRWTAVKGCHASGKTYVASGLVPWWLLAYASDGGVVLTISPTDRQVKNFWREINQSIAGARYRLPFRMQTKKVELASSCFAMGFSASKGVNIQGFHAKKGLLIIDEAPGIIAEVRESIDGILAGGDWNVLEMGNPVVPSGPFFEDFGKNRKRVNPITISAFDSPNCEGLTIEDILRKDEDELRSHIKVGGLVQPIWIRDMYEKWGPSSPQYQARVLGQFPAQSKYSVFNAEWVQRASRELEEKHHADLANYTGVIQVGVDVAGAGDDETAAAARAGQLVIAADAWPEADASNHVLVFLTRLRVKYQKARIVVVVDVIGVGYHLATLIANNGYEVAGFVASGVALDQGSYANAKAEAYHCLAAWMERGMYGVTDLDTQGQLIGVQYKPTPTGQIAIEKKEEAKKRGQSSPDRAEALVMAFVPIVFKYGRVTLQDQPSS